MSTTGLGAQLGRSALNYYIALRLSAGVVAPLGIQAILESPPPIVRRHQRSVDGWDPREVIRLGGSTAVITVRNNVQNTGDAGGRILPN